MKILHIGNLERKGEDTLYTGINDIYADSVILGRSFKNKYRCDKLDRSHQRVLFQYLWKAFEKEAVA